MAAALLEARQALAAAVSTSGLECLPYPPDAPAPPIAFVDDCAIDFTGGGAIGIYFCLPGAVLATVVTCAQRNDRPGGMAYLEGLMPVILDALYALPGVRIASASSGQLDLGGQNLPSVAYQVQFNL